MTGNLREGDKVRWKSHGGEAVHKPGALRKAPPSDRTGKGKR